MNEHMPTRQNMKNKQTFDKWDTLLYLAALLDEYVERYNSLPHNADEKRKRDKYGAWTITRVMLHFDEAVSDRAVDYLHEKNV